MGDAPDNTTNPPSMNAQPSSNSHPVDLTSPTFYKCSQCPVNFLTSEGLHQHQRKYLMTPATTSIATAPPHRGRPPRKDTIQIRLVKPASTEIPIPMVEFTYPLCLTTIGRKALSSHLRTAYQVDKPESFDFRPSRDMTPGRLSCMHCCTNFTMPFVSLQSWHVSPIGCPMGL